MVSAVADATPNTPALELENAMESFLAAACLPPPYNGTDGPVPRPTSYCAGGS